MFCAVTVRIAIRASFSSWCVPAKGTRTYPVATNSAKSEPIIFNAPRNAPPALNVVCKVQLSRAT